MALTHILCVSSIINIFHNMTSSNDSRIYVYLAGFARSFDHYRVHTSHKTRLYLSSTDNPLFLKLSSEIFQNLKEQITTKPKHKIVQYSIS